MINHAKLTNLVESFNKSRNEYIFQFSPDLFDLAAFNFDSSRPATTNKEQLEKIGVDCSDVNGNLEEIVEGLRLIGVSLIFKNMPRYRIVEVISHVINDETLDLWRGEHMSEYVDLDPANEYITEVERTTKISVFGEPNGTNTIFTSKEEFSKLEELIPVFHDGRLDL